MFGGWVQRYRHSSAVLGCPMTFTVFLPPGAEAAAPAPVVFVLSGLTCTDDNFTTKAGAQRAAAELGLALVMPDTSPRGLDVPGEAESWDFGVGAGFYLNATQPKWAAWRMYDYVLQELPAALRAVPGLDVDRVRPQAAAACCVVRLSCLPPQAHHRPAALPCRPPSWGTRWAATARSRSR